MTPATAFGVSLIEQLRLAGMVFEVSNVKEDVFPSRIGKKVK